MRIKIISTLIITGMILMPYGASAKNTEKNVEENTNKTTYQYPLPDNAYETQGYNFVNNYKPENISNDARLKQYEGSVVYVPAKTTVEAVSSETISSETARPGDNVTFYLPSDFYYNNTLIASTGSRINGTVLKVSKGGYGNKFGQLKIRFTNIVTPDGTQIPITASIETSDGSGVLKAGTIKDTSMVYARNAIAGAAAGALAGVLSGALSDGHIGSGAIYGGASGGLFGVTGSALEKGENVEIPQNACMNLVFDQAVTVSPNNLR